VPLDGLGLGLEDVVFEVELEDLVVDELELVGFEVVAEDEEEGPPGVTTLVKVELMSPQRMLLKVTDEFGTFFSTSAGTPEVVAQGPRAMPGLDGSAATGYDESSQSAFAAWSSQSDIESTMPL
jgi:hypothetical protein